MIWKVAPIENKNLYNKFKLKYFNWNFGDYAFLEESRDWHFIDRDKEVFFSFASDYGQISMQYKLRYGLEDCHRKPSIA